MMYLTARGIGMATTTRDYLTSIEQGAESKQESKLPDGPCLLSPSGLIESLTREVIERKPEEFKIACLQDIRSLWPASHNPFYAGFGNRGMLSLVQMVLQDVWSVDRSQQGELRDKEIWF